MNAKMIKQEGYQVELELHIDKEQFDEGIKSAYQKQKGQFTVQGFRKGKAPQHMIERIYGEGVFYEEAINILFPKAYEEAVEETKIDPVDRPNIDIKELDREKGLTILVKVDVKPEVELGEYKGVEIEQKEMTVTDEEVEKTLQQEAEKNARMITVEDRETKKGDIVVIDFEGFLGEEPFEGGKAENHEIEIGSNQFIPGFEDQLIGKNINDEFDVVVTFPEEYQSEELKGKEVTFKVKLHEIKVKELPKLDDEFAKDISEFDTLDEYKNSIKENLTKEKETKANNHKRDQAVIKASQNAKVDIPKAMVEERTKGLLNDMGMRLQQQGMTLEKYAEMTNTSMEQLEEQFEPMAESQVKSQLVLEKIKEVEKIEADEQAVEDELKKMAESYKMKVEEIKEKLNDTYLNQVKEGVAFEKTVDFIIDNAKVVEFKEEKKENK